MNDDIYIYILDFISHWHGISHQVSVEKEKVTILDYTDFGGEFYDFASAKEAIDFIIKEYGYPTKADLIRQTKEL